jgi:RecJ-like exonuclease
MSPADTTPITDGRGFGVAECPHCDGIGKIETYEPPRFENARLPHAVEVPCPTCAARMRVGDGWECDICGTTRPFDADALHDRIVDDRTFAPSVNKPGMLCGECPVCDAATSVVGDPDGALVCDSCGEFYAYQYSDEWYAYAEWVGDGPAVVNPREVLGDG